MWEMLSSKPSSGGNDAAGQDDGEEARRLRRRLEPAGVLLLRALMASVWSLVWSEQSSTERAPSGGGVAHLHLHLLRGFSFKQRAVRPVGSCPAYFLETTAVVGPFESLYIQAEAAAAADDDFGPCSMVLLHPVVILVLVPFRAEGVYFNSLVVI